MQALILLSHGSRQAAANQEMVALAQRMAALKDPSFSEIQYAFQQFAEPAFETVIEDLAKRGFQHVVVCPLFLSSGNHVRVDLPAMIAQATSRYPGMQISTTPHLGGFNGLDRFLLDAILPHVARA